MDGLVVFLIVTSPLILIAGLVLVPQILQAQERRTLFAVVQSMAEKGHELSPDMVAALTQPSRPSREKDLRRGGILLALWAGLILVGVAMWVALAASAVPNAYAAILLLFGIGAIPGCFGLTFVAFALSKPKTA